MSSNKVQFAPARAKLWIGSIDKPKLEVRAQYNPKELAIDKKLTWNETQQMDNRTGEQRQTNSEQHDLDFKGVGKRTMTIELFFDGFESGRSVQGDVETLEKLSTVFNPEAENADERRPHHCLVGMGAGFDAMRPFCCVIESLNTKYTMWDTNGKLLRATCTVGLKEAERLTQGSRPNLSYRIKTRPR